MALHLLKHQLALLREQLEAQCKETDKYRAIAEPPGEYFSKGGFTLAVDLAIAESLTKAHVSRNQVPILFIIFARFFRIRIPTHTRKVPYKKVEGRMTHVERELLYLPGKSHVKRVCSTLNQAHKLQVGVQLLESEDDYCYISDGAESLQSEWLIQLLSRRDASGKLQVTALDLNRLHSKTSEAQHEAFKGSLKLVAELLRDLGITEEVSPRLLNFKVASTMNDRAAPARKAARLVRGVAEGEDDPTCAHHAVTNIYEEGRKSVDAVLREIMNITDEQAESVASKVKAMRTCVGWFSSPACSLIYQVAKYVALFSSKGYAVGAKFRTWLEAELHERKEEAEDEAELLGFVEDMLAICGSRDYVFFMDAAVTDRFAQESSLATFLDEEKVMGAEAGGKLRSSILMGYGSEYIMAAVRTLALICDASLWMHLRCIGSDAHILDVLPQMWPKTLAWFEEMAADPQGVINGSSPLVMEGVREAKATARSKRAELDMVRIRRLIANDQLVIRMLQAAYAAMAKATRNHAAEFLPGGSCAADQVTPELRKRLSGCPMTSTGAERAFALGRAHDARVGACRADSKAGVVLGGMDNTAEFMMGRENGEAEWRQLRKRARKELAETEQAKRLAIGLEERKVRDAKLATSRAKKAAKVAERTRLEGIRLLTLYSELVDKGNDALKDQLKKHKLLGKSTAKFTISQPNRTAYILQLQTLLLEANPHANDLAPGDSGIKGRNIKRKEGAGNKAGKKRKPNERYYMGYVWTAEEEDDFEVEAIVGKLTADGVTEYANQGKAKAGTVLYRIVWQNYPPDMIWYEPAENIGTGLREEFEARAAAEAAEDEAAAHEDAELEALEEEEAMPPP